MSDPTKRDSQHTSRVRAFEEFLNFETDFYSYNHDLLRLVRTDQTRLIVNLDDLRDQKRDLANGLLRRPQEFIPALEEAIEEVLSVIVNDTEKQQIARGYKVGFSGSFGDHHVSPRSLHAEYLGKMLCLEGIVTRCSLVRPKMAHSSHYCPETKQFIERDYRDATSSSNLPPTSSIPPTTDDEGHPLEMEYGFCVFKDHQRISIQEMPERAPAGQLPRSTDVILDDDLVDKCKPGDRIQLVGVYRSVGGGSSGAFK